MKIITRQEYSRESFKEKERKVDRVEKTILKYQETLWEGYTCVDDNTYNACIEYLEKINQGSNILTNDVKIRNFYNIDDNLRECLWDIIDEEAEDMYFMLVPQGMNVTLTYKKGVLISAVTYGRTLGNTDVTETLKKIIGKKNDLIDKEDEVILKGVLVLPHISIDAAKSLCNVQDNYSGVFSILKAISSLGEEEEYIEDYSDMLLFVCTDVEIEGLPIINLESKINYIKEYGIETAPIIKIQRESSDLITVENALYEFETLYGDVDYKTEGVKVIPTDERNEDVYLLKVKKWSRLCIKATIEDIYWENSITGYKAILKLDREIEFYGGLTIDSIKLDNILYLLFLGIDKGQQINFIYSEDIGILLLDEDNNLIIL